MDIDAKEAKFKTVFYKIVDLIPILIPAVLAIVGFVAVSFLLIDRFSSIYIYLVSTPFILITAIIFYRNQARLSQKSPGTQKERRFIGVLLLISVLIWTGFNLKYNSQHVYTNRDPATYAVTGAWLVKHDNVNIERLPEYNKVNKVDDISAGFGVNTQAAKYLFAQGTHILPAFLGLFGRIVGQVRIFPLNVIIGGAALLGFYALARLLVRPRWAFFSVASLAISLPFLYFSRDTYTEPIMLAFVFGGLALLVSAVKNGQKSYWLLAGLTLGASALARIDAYMPLALTLPFLFFYLRNNDERKVRLKNSALFLLGVTLVGFIGYLDVKILSSGYHDSSWKLLKPEFLAVAAIVSAGIIYLSVAWSAIGSKIAKHFASRWILAVPIAVTLLLIGLFIRPLISDQYKETQIIQQDGNTQNGKELTHKDEAPIWLAWYIGPISVLAGASGLILMIYKTTKDGEEQSEIFLLITTVIVGTSIVYFIRPSIAADQIWAARRLLPIIMPGFLLAAGYLLGQIYDGRIKLPIRHKVNQQAAIASIATLAAVSPLLISIPFIDKASFTQLSGVLETCEALPDDSIVLWLGVANREAPMSTRAFCDVPSLGYYRTGSTFADENLTASQVEEAKTTLSKLSDIASKNGKTLFVGEFYDEIDTVAVDEKQKDPRFAVRANFSNIEYVKGRPPRVSTEVTRFISIWSVKTDGSIKSYLK